LNAIELILNCPFTAERKKADTLYQLCVEVISHSSIFGFPRENFIPDYLLYMLQQKKTSSVFTLRKKKNPETVEVSGF
jgi:hypothetical protein